MLSYSRCCCDANLLVTVFDARAEAFPAVSVLWETWAAEGVTVIAPTLLRFEVTNAVYRMARAAAVTTSWATETITMLDSVEIHYVDYRGLHTDAFSIAHELGMPAAYDAHYLALARRQGVDFYTLDRKLVNTAARRFPFVRYALDG